MANTYSWTIHSMEVIPSIDGLTNVVSIVSYFYNGISPTNTHGKIFGNSIIPFTPSENFTLYSELTQDIVISWLESTLDVPNLQTRVDAQINLIENPPTITIPLPWGA